MTSFFDSTLLKHKGYFNGGILIAKGGNIVFEAYSGYKNLQHRTDTMDAHTALHIASTSKTFTAIAILNLVNQGMLSLEDSLISFFPTLPYKGVTIRMLLSHRSGIPNYVHFMDATSWDKKKYCSNQDVVDIIIREKPPRSYPPNTHFEYSNTNYILLALIIEKISGLTYPAYMQKYFFEPLQMNDTYVYTLADSNKAVSSFTESGRKWDFDYLDLTYGDKNIYSTPRDLLKWDQALYTNQLVSDSLLQLAFSPNSNEKKSFHNYGLGFRLIQPPGTNQLVIYHFGRWHGNNSAFARIPSEKATIIIIGNRFSRSIYTTAHLAYPLFNISQEDAGKEDE